RDLDALLLEDRLRDLGVGGRAVPRVRRDGDRAAPLARRGGRSRRAAGLAPAAAAAGGEHHHHRDRDHGDEPPLAPHHVLLPFVRDPAPARPRPPHPWVMRSRTTASATIAMPASTPRPSSPLVRP